MTAATVNKETNLNLFIVYNLTIRFIIRALEPETKSENHSTSSNA